MNGKKLGELLLEEDVLTKRQLNKALDLQKGGDKRKIGEILIELGFLLFFYYLHFFGYQELFVIVF